MAIADELTKLEANRANIVAAINSKGGELAENAGLAACPEAISQLSSAGGTTSWTGHVDEAGLRYIGWDDEDIANLKANICWNAEDDALYAVPQDHKDLWDACEKVVVNGRTMLAYSELSKWVETNFSLVYLPYIDFSSATSIKRLFSGKYSLVGLPLLNITNVNDIRQSFTNCYNLVCLPKFKDISSTWQAFMGCIRLKKIEVDSLTELSIESSNLEVVKINKKDIEFTSAVFLDCFFLKKIPSNYNVSGITNANNIYSNCYSLEEINLTFNIASSFIKTFLNCKNLKILPTINSKIINATSMFDGCKSIIKVPEYDFSECTQCVSIFSRANISQGAVVIDFPSASNLNSACNAIRCKKIKFKFYDYNTSMGGIFSTGFAYEMSFDSASVLTGVTNVNNLPFNNASNRINKEAVTYKLVKEVCEMLLRGIPNYTADSYPMYFESGSTVTDDAAGTLQSLVEQCQAMGWAIYNLTINPYTE